MASSVGFPPILLILILTTSDQTYSNSLNDDCPTNCVCYQDYMSNLASWKWIEKDINIQRDDPLHEDFNPYTEHNEVYDNPMATKKKQAEQRMETATCILRTNFSESIERTLESLRPTVQVLTLIQVPGTGLITLQKVHLEKLHSLIGLEIQGYSASDHKPSQTKSQDTLSIAADAFESLQKLTYLSMDSVVLQQRSVENQLHDSIRTVTYNITTNENSLNNEIRHSEIILLKSPSSEENLIVPYTVYKETKGQRQSLPPKIAVAFTKLSSLQHLRICGSNLQDISWDMFYKLDNLKFLLLEKNDLLFLPDYVFYATSNLTALSLSNNRILNLQTVGLVGLLYLQKLDVSNNNITYLSELSLPPFPHLEIADFRHNPIESIFPNTFEVMNSTKTLFLGSHATPVEFSPNSFYGLISLNRLDILNVNLDTLERPMLKGMPELESLTMTGKITRILYDAFSEVSKLEKLILKQCSIKKISMDAFFGLTSLIELDLSHNELTFLPPGIFDQQVSLREVFLQMNKLQTLPPSIFSNIPAKIIRLEENPWHCSCDMKYWNSRLTNQVKRYHVPMNSSICNFQYDKGSACKDFIPTFQVKYVYEKRVSPTCVTPLKFRKKNVFEVMRKGLHYCANTLQQNISILLTSSNPTDKLEIMGTVKIPIDQSQNKELEKQRLFPPKIKKPWKVNTITIATTPVKSGDEVISSALPLPTQPLPAAQSTSESLVSSSSPIRVFETAPTNATMLSEIAMQNPQLQQTTETEPSSAKLFSPVARNKKALHIVNNNSTDITETMEYNSISNRYPKISKKALKYASEQRRYRQRQG